MCVTFHTAERVVLATTLDLVEEVVHATALRFVACAEKNKANVADGPSRNDISFWKKSERCTKSQLSSL